MSSLPVQVPGPQSVGIDIPFDGGCLHPLAHVFFPPAVGPFVLFGATQYDRFGHDISAAYGDMTADRSSKVTAYVYPGCGTGRDALAGVIAQARAAHPSARVLSEEEVQVAGQRGWYAETAIPMAFGDGVAVPSRSAIWLFEAEGWHVKYRATAREGTDMAALGSDIRTLIETVGWPCAQTRIRLGAATAHDAMARAMAALQPWLDACDDCPLTTVVRDAGSAGDIDAVIRAVQGAGDAAPLGLRSLATVVSLEAGNFLGAFHLTATCPDEEEQQALRSLCENWISFEFAFDPARGGRGESVEAAVDLGHGFIAEAAHAQHRYLAWTLGERGRDWRLIDVAVLRTSAGPREAARVLLSDGRQLVVWFSTGLPAPFDAPVDGYEVLARFCCGKATLGEQPARDTAGEFRMSHELWLNPEIPEDARELREFLQWRLREHHVQVVIRAPDELF